MMRQKLILIMMLMLPISMNAQKKQFDWIPVMDAIIQVESKGNPKAHNPVGDCAGILQITKGLVRECNSILESQKSKKRYSYSDRYNAKKSKEMFVLLQEHFNPEHNVEKAIRCWNRGFYGNWRGKSTKYYNKVMKYYKGG
jgi:hypothetical protein